jgi:hypothetical protein
VVEVGAFDQERVDFVGL